jgi:hypothetical protein
MPGQPFMQADDHQPAALGAFLIELVELIDQLLLVIGRRESGKAEAGDVVEVNGRWRTAPR